MHFPQRYIMSILLQKPWTINLTMNQQKKPRSRGLKYLNQKDNLSRGQDQDTSFHQPGPELIIPLGKLTSIYSYG